jgi:hypothetical protein
MKYCHFWQRGWTWRSFNIKWNKPDTEKQIYNITHVKYFKFLRNIYTTCHSNGTIFHSSQHCTSVSISPCLCQHLSCVYVCVCVCVCVTEYWTQSFTMLITWLTTDTPLTPFFDNRYLNLYEEIFQCRFDLYFPTELTSFDIFFSHCICQSCLSLWKYLFKGGKIYFSLMISEVSVHCWLALLFQGLWWGRASW